MERTSRTTIFAGCVNTLVSWGKLIAPPLLTTQNTQTKYNYSSRQEPVLFNMTIRDNILMGATEPVSERKLVEVCQMANCHNFISMLPDGYDTNVGEHGSMLSGGQKQRIGMHER
jgi:ABC-type multidrug transport system fused ATPase/permease subunit